MKQLSFWAKNNRYLSWVLIAALHVFLIYLAVYASVVLFLEDIVLPFNIWYASLGIAIAIYFFYPIKNVQKGWFKPTFFKRKGLDFTIVLASFFMILTLFNQLTLVNHQESRIPATEAQAQNVILAPKAEKEVKNNRVKRWLKKRHQKRAERIKKHWEKFTDGQKVGLIILTLLVGLIAAYGVALLGCSLACSGSEVLGNIVFIGGWAAILIGVIVIIRNILKHKSTPEPKSSD